MFWISAEKMDFGRISAISVWGEIYLWPKLVKFDKFSSKFSQISVKFCPKILKIAVIRPSRPGARKISNRKPKHRLWLIVLGFRLLRTFGEPEGALTRRSPKLIVLTYSGQFYTLLIIVLGVPRWFECSGNARVCLRGGHENT